MSKRQTSLAEDNIKFESFEDLNLLIKESRQVSTDIANESLINRNFELGAFFSSRVKEGIDLDIITAVNQQFDYLKVAYDVKSLSKTQIKRFIKFFELYQGDEELLNSTFA